MQSKENMQVATDSNKYRIGYVLKMYPRFSETFIVSEILALEQAGYKLDIFSLRAPVDGRFHRFISEVAASVTYIDSHPIKATRLWEAIREVSWQKENLWSVLEQATQNDADDIFQALLLSKIVIERRIPHLHAHFASVAARVASLTAQICEISHSFTAHAKDIYHDSVDYDALSAAIKRASFAVTISEYNHHFMSKRNGGPQDTLYRIYNGLDLSSFKPSPVERRGEHILAVGRLVEKKGFHYLVRACAHLRSQGVQIPCLIIGSGPEEVMLRELIHNLDLQDLVRMAGPKTRDEVIQDMSRASMFIAPCIVGSDGNRDGLPTVLLEAMALGTPCISTDVTGIPELIEHEETGLLVSQNDWLGLANAIMKIRTDKKLRETLSSNARRIIEEKFDIHKNVKDLARLFEMSIDSRSVRSALS